MVGAVAVVPDEAKDLVEVEGTTIHFFFVALLTVSVVYCRRTNERKKETADGDLETDSYIRSVAG